MKRIWLSLALILLPAGSLSARTITITADDCDLMAVISEVQPRMSWAVLQMGPGVYDTHPQIQLYPNMTVLICFPLDKIPKGQRITKAEFSINVQYVAGGKNLHVRRILQEWGTGVCHTYRMVYPKKLEWAKPGGRGITSDRANKVSAIFDVEKAGAKVVDVTQDIELWYTGAVPNYGWFISLEEGGVVYLNPIYPTGTSWKLQITYEPR